MDCVAFPPLDQIDQILSIAARPTEPGQTFGTAEKIFIPSAVFSAICRALLPRTDECAGPFCPVKIVVLGYLTNAICNSRQIRNMKAA